LDAPISRDAAAARVVAVTKLRVPELRDALVPRADLIAALGSSPASRLTLVTGPAGAGKTTVVLQWRAATEAEHPFAWLALDSEDRDVVRFWGLVIEALGTVHEGFGASAAVALRAGPRALLDAVIPRIINEAAALPGRTVLVLDDLHMLEGADDVHASLAALLDGLPPSLHVAVTSRSTPPLPVPRLRARGQLDELRAGDLQFGAQDAAALLRRGFGVTLAEGQVARLQARTEGWAAGLHLAGISLGRRGADFETFMEALAGPEADIPSYLAAEVLEGQPPDVRDFLLRTSILDRLSGPLCDAVTGAGDGGLRLEDLARRNLLIEPLDSQREWWRCHGLFAELLEREARAALGSDEVTTMHRRAAAWHSDFGEPGEAVRHALAGGQPDLAATLVAEHWETRFNRGELTLVAGWLNQLPPAELARQPRLWLARLWTAMDRGRLEEAEAQLAEAHGTVPPAVQSWGALLSALHAFKRGDLAAAHAGLAPVAELDTGDPFWQTVAEHVRGLLAYWEGRAFAAAAHFGRAGDLAAQDGNRLGQAYALGYLALMAADAGEADLARARRAAFDALGDDDAAIGEHFVASVAALARGRELARGGSYEAAVPVLERAIALSARGAGRLEMIAPRLELAVVHRARGRREAALGCLNEAREILVACPDPGALGPRLAAVERDVIGPAGGDDDGSPVRGELTAGELAVLALLPSPLSQREIGDELFISINTVKTHCRNIYTKLRAGSREQAVGRARDLGLIPKSSSRSAPRHG